MKLPKTTERTAGIDVSAKTLHVAIRGHDGAIQAFDVKNDPAGHAEIVKRLTTGSKKGRVTVEATGSYHLDLAIALVEAGIALMVVNPKAARRFAQAQMRRAKTDAVDSLVLLDFCERMPFVPWSSPRRPLLELRCVARRLHDLNVQRTAELNRLHAVETTDTTPDAVRDDLRVSIQSLEARFERMLTQAVSAIKQDPALERAYRHITLIQGIKDRSAVALLGELTLLPSEMTAREVTAHAGLDPRPYESGTSVKGRRGISKVGNARLRAALHMPALVACQHCPPFRDLYQRLVAKGKLKMVALVAVARRILEIVWYLLQNDVPFDPDKVGCRPASAPQSRGGDVTADAEASEPSSQAPAQGATTTLAVSPDAERLAPNAGDAERPPNRHQGDEPRPPSPPGECGHAPTSRSSGPRARRTRSVGDEHPPSPGA